MTIIIFIITITTITIFIITIAWWPLSDPLPAAICKSIKKNMADEKIPDNKNNTKVKILKRFRKSISEQFQSSFDAEKRRQRRHKDVSVQGDVSSSSEELENALQPGGVDVATNLSRSNSNNNNNNNNNNTFDDDNLSHNSIETLTRQGMQQQQPYLPLPLPQIQPHKTSAKQRQKLQQQPKKHQHNHMTPPQQQQQQQQQQIILRYKINENEPAGSRLANLIQDADLSHVYGTQLLNGSLTFAFLSDSVEFFAIEPTTGVIRTTALVDRENAILCRGQKDTCEVALDVVVQPAKYFRIIKVREF